MTLLDQARAIEHELVSLRRELHQNPELSFQEVETARRIVKELSAIGLEPRTGVGKTGVVADITNGGGPTVALRADMDALPIQEANDHGFASRNPGVMHACGHDAHMASLVGAARLLVAARSSGSLPSGTVRLLFQPSEETGDEEGKSGAMRMVEDGAMEGVDAVVGLHVGAHVEAGKLFFRDGPTMAGSEEIKIVVRGKSAHAARPHEGVDALVLAAQGITAAQQAVSRTLDPHEAGVVTFGRIEGGTAPNVIADRVFLHGTLRYFSVQVRERLAGAVTAAFQMLESFGATVEVRIGPGYPPLVNDSTVTEVVRAAAAELIGPDAVLGMEPILGAEDFAILAQQAPGAFFWLGAALPEPREHHHPRFDIDDSVLPIGSGVLAQGAIALLKKLG